MPYFNSNIVIDKNNISYENEVLKISNISRTWIFRFQNKEKKAYELEKENYERAKKNYELREKYKKNREVKNYSIACILIALVSVYILQSSMWGLLVLAISIASAFMAIKKYRKKINYEEEPPKEKEFPNKFGLGIEMNSGYVTIFAAEGKEGVLALKKLQNDIKEADVHNGKTVFNMNEYNVKVEGDVEGILNVGDDNVNINGRKELSNV